MKMTQAQYDEHLDSCDGYCLSCDKVTAEDVEPEEMGERCPDCDGVVYGMESALTYEYLDLSDRGDEEDDEDNIISFSDDEDDDY